mmetsp:Transcript_1560/g.2230  ORF Transcript_1560/g.2230 Transcript_1560/m.2230 type:complete len:295 (-) Transcript_1560:262-1146(-)
MGHDIPRHYLIVSPSIRITKLRPTMILKLPEDLILKIFSHLGTIPDIAHASQASKDLLNCTKSPKLWMEFAIRKYGNRAAHQSIDLYKGDWKAMLQDDNKEGVHPTVERVWKSNYAYNCDDYYYVCLVTAIQFDRTKEELLVYVDARGESDLRHPQTSYLYSEVVDGREIMIEYHNRAAEFKSFLQQETAGHFKGVLSFRLGNVPTSGRKFNFLFANRDPRWSDYERITLLDIDEEKGIYENLQQMDGFKYLPKDQHPFINDTPQVERERWELHVPSSVLQSDRRRDGMRKWWL